MLYSVKVDAGKRETHYQDMIVEALSIEEVRNCVNEYFKGEKVYFSNADIVPLLDSKCPVYSLKLFINIITE